MKTKKIPISFNAEDQRNISELIDLMGIRDVYGDVPKAVKFGIQFTLSAIKNSEKVYSDLEPHNLDQYFSCLKQFEKQEKQKILQEFGKKLFN